MNNKKFEKDGYLIFKTDLINNQNFNNLTKEIYLNLNHQLKHTDIKILRRLSNG